MTTKTLRGGLIGCGFFAHNHMNAWAGLAGAEIVAVCDLDARKAASMADDFGVAHRYSDAANMLGDQQLDFVDIATTVDSHRQLVELVCGRGIAAICQKPMAESMADALAMADAASKAKVPLVIHENFRWQKGFQAMAAMLAEGRIGRLHFARFSFRHGYDNYKNQPYLATIERFTIMDVGLHLFDLARFFLGDVARLSCTTQRLNPKVRGEDAFTALLAHENGATSICDCSFETKLDPEPFPQTVATIEGEKGTLDLSADMRLVLHRPGRRETFDVEPAVPAWGAKPWHNIQDSVIRFQAHAIEALSGRAEPQPSGADNCKTVALALAAYESAERGATIDMRGWREVR
jgi:predicted dehydrogenase